MISWGASGHVIFFIFMTLDMSVYMHEVGARGATFSTLYCTIYNQFKRYFLSKSRYGYDSKDILYFEKESKHIVPLSFI